MALQDRAYTRREIRRARFGRGFDSPRFHHIGEIIEPLTVVVTASGPHPFVVALEVTTPMADSEHSATGLTLRDRVNAYAAKFPKRPPFQVVTEGAGAEKHEVIYGQKVVGNDYRNKTRYYGAYPAGYLEMVYALFPDVPEFDAERGRLNHLHVFSGSLPEGMYVRCDIAQPAEIKESVYDLEPGRDGRYRLVLADPPYSEQDAKKYGTPMVDRGRAMRSIANVTEIGCHLVWLDTTWPMHRKDQWRTVGRIGLTRSTNHRVRMVTIFERVAA
jgi:hypothetical protein